MWQLEQDKEGERFPNLYHVIVDEELTVGRKGTDIIIIGDPSVSRKHASLQTFHPMSNITQPNLKPHFKVEDGASKYGTFVNGKQFDSKGQILKNGDLITFGQCGSNFKVIYTPMVVATSCLEPHEKSSLKDVVRKLGGHVVDEWNSVVTHLAMSKIKVTVKTVCALISNKPIVIPEYFKMLLDSYNDKKPPGEPEAYLPPVNEVLLSGKSVSFLTHSSRREIFKGKTFIFLSVQQYMKLRLPIILAEGKAILINRSRCDVTPELMLSSCIIHCPTEAERPNSQGLSQTCSIKEAENIEKLLKKHKKRFIPESDIGLAVVHCSVDQYCNPDYVFDSSTEILTLTNNCFRIQSQTLSQNYVHVPDTIASTQSIFDNSLSSSVKKTTPVKVIPPTYRSSMEHTAESGCAQNEVSTVAKKRPASHETNGTSSSKVSRTETSSTDLFKQPDTLRSPGTRSNVVNSVTENLSDETALSDHMPTSVRGVKRSLVHESQNKDAQQGSSKREKLDTPVARTVPCTVKSEPLSPHTQDDQELNYDVDTQPTSLTLFKDESQDHELTSPCKRTYPETLVLESTSQRLYSQNTNLKENENIAKVIPNTKILSENTVLQPDMFVSKSVKLSASAHTGEKVDGDDDLPSKLIVVKMADLVVQRSNNIPARGKGNHANNSTSMNFKKFKKSAHSGYHSLPTIIGSDDLLVYTSKENLNDLNEWLQDHETQNTQPNVVGNCNTSFRASFAKPVQLK